MLATRDSRRLFLCLLVICASSSTKRLLVSFSPFFVGLFVLSLLICVSSSMSFSLHYYVLFLTDTFVTFLQPLKHIKYPYI
jgi:hypothetical protein